MASISKYLTTTQPSPNHYKIAESPNATSESSESRTLPKSELRRSFPEITPVTTTEYAPGTMAFTWNGGPVEVTGIVYIESLKTSFELLFNDGDAGSRIIGEFKGDLTKGVEVEVFDARGARSMRLEMEVREGRYVHADAERGHWAKKRVVCILPSEPSAQI